MNEHTRDELEAMLAQGIQSERGMSPKELLNTAFKGISFKCLSGKAVEYYFDSLWSLIHWLREDEWELIKMERDEIRVPSIKPFYLRSAALDVSEVISHLTRHFALRITSEDKLDLIVLYGLDVAITPNSKVWVDVNDAFDQKADDKLPLGHGVLITPLTDPEFLKSQISRVRKALEHIEPGIEEFELTAIWTGWFEKHILTKNPKLAESIHIIRAVDNYNLNRISSNLEVFELSEWFDYDDLIQKCTKLMQQPDINVGRLAHESYLEKVQKSMIANNFFMYD